MLCPEKNLQIVVSPEMLTMRNEIQITSAPVDSCPEDVTEVDKTYTEYESVNSICSLCLKEIRDQTILKLEACGHELCKKCLELFIRKKIEIDEIEMIKCPLSCGSVIKITALKSFLSKDGYQRYLAAKKRHLGGEESVIKCPIENCDSFILKVSKEGNKFHFLESESRHNISLSTYSHDIPEKHNLKHFVQTCENGHKVCSKCCKKFHLGHICDDNDSKIRKDEIQSMICINCTNTVTKTVEKGNKMECDRCNVMFCFICKNQINVENDNHFESLCSPCYNLQFEGSDSCLAKYSTFRTFMVIFVLVTAALKSIIKFALGFLIFCFPTGYFSIIIIQFFKTRLVNKKVFPDTCKTDIFFYSYYFFLFLAFVPINFFIISVGFIALPFLFISWIYHLFARKDFSKRFNGWIDEITSFLSITCSKYI